MRVYLAGPIFQCHDAECINWRSNAKENLQGFDVIDPMERDYRGVTDQNYKEIVEIDKELIEQSDILLVNHIKPSAGTAMEILFAWERDKHIVVVSNEKENSPWIIYHSHKIAPSLNQAINYIKTI